MTATGIETRTRTQEMRELKNHLKTTWMAGDYVTFSRFMAKESEVFYTGLGVTPGTRLLDVACGSGQIALIAARAGAKVTGCDIAPNWIEYARERAEGEGLAVQFDEGDAEALPYNDCQFDAVVSFAGAMFAPRPELVASELTRVCRPGGMIAMANWTSEGFVGQMFKTMARHVAPSAMLSPVLWGDRATVRDRFREGICDLVLTQRIFHFDYPFGPERVVEFFRVNYGPMTRAFASLSVGGQAQLRRALVDLWSLYNNAVDGSTCVSAEYLEVVASRSGGRVN